jgi:hypothetical protein
MGLVEDIDFTALNKLAQDIGPMVAERPESQEETVPSRQARLGADLLSVATPAIKTPNLRQHSRHSSISTVPGRSLALGAAKGRKGSVRPSVPRGSVLVPANRKALRGASLLDDDLDQKEDLIKVELLESPAKIRRPRVHFKSSGMAGMLQ